MHQRSFNGICGVRYAPSRRTATVHVPFILSSGNLQCGANCFYAMRVQQPSTRCGHYLISLAAENATAKTFLEHLLTNLWVDFAVPCMDGRPTEEGNAFWTTLQRRAPELAREARECHAARRVIEKRKDGFKAAAVRQSRSLFVEQQEALCVRRVAERMSFVPAALQVDVVGGRVRVADAELHRFEAWEGLKPAHGDDGFINGTRICFPADGPRCRYEAFFDARDAFDALRESFMTFAPESSPAAILPPRARRP